MVKVKGKRIEETGKRVEWIIKLNGLIAPVKSATLVFFEELNWAGPDEIGPRSFHPDEIKATTISPR
jgi:hypothetical protein